MEPISMDNSSNADKVPRNEGLTKTEKSKATAEKKRKVGRPPRKDKEPPQWTIRGVDIETRNAIEKAKERSGAASLGVFFNTSIREHCQSVIKLAGKPPASPRDVEQMIDAQLTTKLGSFKDEIIAAMKENQTENKTFLQKLADIFRNS